MVDFRYHLVSVIAIFLALAVGIVVGTTALNGTVLDNLRGSISSLSGDKRSLEANVKDLRRTVSKDDAFANLVGPTLVRGQLTGQKVLVLSMPDASTGLRDALISQVVLAGGEITGQIRLKPDLLDPTKTSAVDDLVANLGPPEGAVPGTPAQRAGAELAGALVRRPGAPASGAAAQKVLAGFTGAELLAVETEAVQPTATLVLVVSGPAPVAAPDVGQRNAAALALAAAFDSRAGVVVVGPAGAADAPSVLRALRDDGTLTERVSSVDDADTPEGRITTVFALHQQVSGGAGRYGTGQGAQAPAPTPSPSP